MLIEGVFLDGLSAKRYPARLNAELDRCRGWIELSDTGQDYLPIDINDLRFESRLANTPREILLGDGRLFLCEHSADIERLEALNSGPSTALMHRLENHLVWVVVSVLFTAVFIGAVFTHGIPSAAKVIAFNMPEMAANQFGGTLGVLDRTVLDESELDVERQQRLRAFLTPYNQSVSGLSPRLVFRHGLQANAFALPAGEIILTDDLVNLASNDEQLLAVYFHELGHLQHKHIVRRAIQGSMLAVLVVLISNDVSNVDLLSGLPALLMDLSYSRQFEIEADEFALQQMRQHGVAVEHFAEIMNKLEAFYQRGENSVGEGLPHFLSTHPNTKQRIALIKQYQ